ncbi:RICIN domain-containing protein [Streptomyces sviceus]|uniref:RICIN domain-containing protein n=1 Tax=Streptomyces sviceus TaxID=285530 RepID=UPI00367EFBED
MPGRAAPRVTSARSHHPTARIGATAPAGEAAVTSQQWTLTDTGNGCFKLVNLGNGLVADIASASTANGALLVQTTDTSASAELRQIVRGNRPTSGPALGTPSGRTVAVRVRDGAEPASVEHVSGPSTGRSRRHPPTDQSASFRRSITCQETR